MAASTALVIFPRLARAGIVAGLVAGMAALAVAGGATAWVTGDRSLALGAGLALLLVVALCRRWLAGWTWLATEVFLVAGLAAAVYVAYSAQQTVEQSIAPRLLPVLLASSVLLILGEIAAMGLALSYLFEILDVVGRPIAPPTVPPAQEPGRPWPLVVLQVPMYNEPVELVGETLAALDRLDYPNLLIQVVDNNTADPAVWQPIQRLCSQLGPRFRFLHLAPWPGYKAGALNEATRRLPQEVEIVGIVDADYLVRPGFLLETVPYFQDPQVGFVQTPQHYRDWEDDAYLRGLFHSYRYFFDITMPARAHRDAIIFCGTMGLIRRSVLDEIGGWNEDCITEDAEASLRMLGRGYRGVYHQVPWGEGLMPLTFDGLKTRRFRWALGGIQILRYHWRELLPLMPHRLHLPFAQRWHYLVGAAQWFADLLLIAFTLLLLATAAATAAHHRLPVRQITGAVLVIPLLFLIFGLLRAVWAMRRSGVLTWGDAVRALRVWFALSWTVALADIPGTAGLQGTLPSHPQAAQRPEHLAPGATIRPAGDLPGAGRDPGRGGHGNSRSHPDHGHPGGSAPLPGGGLPQRPLGQPGHGGHPDNSAPPDLPQLEPERCRAGRFPIHRGHAAGGSGPGRDRGPDRGLRHRQPHRERSIWGIGPRTHHSGPLPEQLTQPQPQPIVTHSLPHPSLSPSPSPGPSAPTSPSPPASAAPSPSLSPSPA